MSQLVVLNLGKGNWQQGFPMVTVQLWEVDRSTPIQFTGELPASPKLPELYKEWRALYEALSKRLTWRRVRQTRTIEIEEEAPTNVSEAAFDELCQQLKSQLDAWLDSGSFRKVDQRLRAKLTSGTEIRVVIEAEDSQLRRFPWHLWSFFEDYPHAEVALGTQDYGRAAVVSRKSTNRVRILAVLGSSEGIKVQEDRRFLERLPETDIVFLVEPQRSKLDQWLWDDRGWDILFFAGHSASQANDTIGQLAINRTTNLSISQLKNAVAAAIARGLKLAIFNSCDGLGLAREMAELNVPQLIVMREPVPDQVAQEFLKHLLQAFSKGKSFYLSVREARKRLQGLEGEFPCASWLPVICQNPAEAPPTWSELRSGKPDWTPKLSSKHSLRTAFFVSGLMVALVVGMRQLGLLQSWELNTLDHLMQLRPKKEGSDPRLLIITVTAKDVQAQTEKQGSLSNRALSQLLDKLESYHPAMIGLDIYRQFPVEPQYKSLAKRLRQDNSLVTVCEASVTDDNPGFQPPTEVPSDRVAERVGFSNVVPDFPKGTIRRHLLLQSPGAICQADNAFNLRLALRYLEAKNPGIEAKRTATGDVQIGDVVFKRLDANAGGYELPQSEAAGFQVLLNYRATDVIAPQLTLEEAMTGNRLSENLVRGRIVLIGTIDPRFRDFHFTPYNQDTAHRMPGVILQAHMVSQILSAVLDGRPLLWWWSEWGEVLWIGTWSLLGGLLVWRFRSWVGAGTATVVALVVLYVCCYLLLLRGGWVPLVPSALVLVVTAGAIVSYTRLQTG